MSGAWWTRDAPTSVRPPRGALAPELVPGDRARLLAGFDERIPGFAPEWTGRGPDDAGNALRLVFGEQLEAVAQRLNRWPDKAMAVFLNAAGISAFPGSAATVLLTFEVSDGAAQSVLVPSGFQAGGNLPGADAIVIFETELDLYVAPAKLGEIFVSESGGLAQVDPMHAFAAFGERPTTASALWIGLSGVSAPTQRLTLYLGVVTPSGAPPPVASGGVAPLPEPPGPVLHWDLVDGGHLVELDVLRDETANLARAGLVELALPDQWRPGQPAGMGAVTATRWLRLRIAYGKFSEPPRLDSLSLNVTRAIGARTVRDEVPVPVGGSGGRRFRLSQTPVMPGSLRLEVDDTALSGSGRVLWREVPDLSAVGPDGAVYELDVVSGEVEFGDGLHGRALPQGYRNVHAVSYQVRSAVPDTVAADAVTVPVSAIAGIVKVTNPTPGAGGGPAETDAQTRQNGPLEIRTRWRAVAPADYGVLATQVDGAQVARAFAVPGLDPRYPGASIPGVVGLFVVPPDRGAGMPIPDPETLRAVTTSLSTHAAPAGAAVIAAAPSYHGVSIQAGILLSDGADSAASMRTLLQALSNWLHPITGGDDGAGWPFGGAIRYTRLLRVITGVAGVRAAPRVNVVLDGLRRPACQDVAIPPYSLLWPSGHQALVLDPAGTS